MIQNVKSFGISISFLSLGQRQQLSSQIIQVAMANYFFGLNMIEMLPVHRSIKVCISQPMIWPFYTQRPNPKIRLFSIRPSYLVFVSKSPKPKEYPKELLLLEW
jgi:hypothetical protein